MRGKIVRRIITAIILGALSVGLFFFTGSMWPAIFPGFVVFFMVLLYRDSVKRRRRGEMSQEQFQEVAFITMVLGVLNIISAILQIIQKIIA